MVSSIASLGTAMTTGAVAADSVSTVTQHLGVTTAGLIVLGIVTVIGFRSSLAAWLKETIESQSGRLTDGSPHVEAASVLEFDDPDGAEVTPLN